MLQATSTAFPGAAVTCGESLAIEVIFTTGLGLRVQVGFRIARQVQRVDFRSRSLSGWFDRGKNRYRTQVLTTRFAAQARP